MQPFSHSQGPKVAISFFTNPYAVTRVLLAPSNECKWFIPKDSPLISPICHWMEAYLQKKVPSPLPIELPSLPSFTRSLLLLLKEISQPITYQELANLLGHPKANRAVGNGCHRNPLPLLIPCHRVIGSGGKIGGFAFGKDVKYELLKFESPQLASDLLEGY